MPRLCLSVVLLSSHLSEAGIHTEVNPVQRRQMTLVARSFLALRIWACMCKPTFMTDTGRTLGPLRPSTRPIWPSPRTPSLTTGQPYPISMSLLVSSNSGGKTPQLHCKTLSVLAHLHTCHVAAHVRHKAFLPLVQPLRAAAVTPVHSATPYLLSAGTSIHLFMWCAASMTTMRPSTPCPASCLPARWQMPRSATASWGTVPSSEQAARSYTQWWVCAASSRRTALWRTPCSWALTTMRLWRSVP